MENKWIVNFTLTLTALGVAGGLILGGLNPWVSPAQARQLDMETSHQKEVYEIEQEAQRQKMNREQEDWEQSAANRQRFAEIVLFFAQYTFAALSIVLNLGLLILAAAKAFTILRTSRNQPTTKNQATKSNPGWMAVRTQARNNELIWRALQTEQRQREQQQIEEQRILLIRIQSVCDPARVSAGEYNSLPLAE